LTGFAEAKDSIPRAPTSSTAGVVGAVYRVRTWLVTASAIVAPDQATDDPGRWPDVGVTAVKDNTTITRTSQSAKSVYTPVRALLAACSGYSPGKGHNAPHCAKYRAAADVRHSAACQFRPAQTEKRIQTQRDVRRKAGMATRSATARAPRVPRQFRRNARRSAGGNGCPSYFAARSAGL